MCGAIDLKKKKKKTLLAAFLNFRIKKSTTWESFQEAGVLL